MNFTFKCAIQCGLLFIALILQTEFSFAQNELRGIVTSSGDADPVFGAVIRLNNSLAATVSDAQGRFVIKGISAGNYEISITHVAFETKSMTVSTTGENKIILDPKTYLADEITINATRVNQRTGAAFNNVTKTDLEKNNLGQDLPVLLNNLPSVVVTSDAGNGVGYTGIRVRGNDPTRVNVTINGIPVNDAESHQVYWVDLPDVASSTDNIQFQRGLGSSTNGAGAFGASINLQTTKISQSAYGSISSSIGSFNTNKNSVSFGTGILNNHFTIDGRLSLINSDGYIDRATSNLHSFSLSGGYYDSKQFIRAVIISGKEKTYQAWFGISEDQLKTDRTYNPAGEYTDAYGNIRYYDDQTDNYQQDYYQLFYSRSITKELTANFALHYTKGKGYYEEFKPMASLEDYGLSDVIIGDTAISETDIIRQKWLSNDFYGGTWSFDYNKESLDLKFGGAANSYTGRHYNQIIAAGVYPVSTFPFTYYDDEAVKTDVNFFLKATYDVNSKLSVTGDLQERFINYNFSKNVSDGSAKAALSFFNPKAGLTYRVSSKHKFYFFAGVGHKEPVRDDYLASAPTSRPDPEQMTDYEAGYNYNAKKLEVTLNGYYMDYQNQLILTGQINDVGEYIRENVKNSYRLGIEAEISYQLNKDLVLSGNLTLSENKIKEYHEYTYDADTYDQIINTYRNTTISFSPAVISSATVNYTLLKNIQLALTTKFVGAQYLDNTTNENSRLDSYFLTNFSGSYSIPVKGIKSLELKFMLNNIFDKMYSANGYTYNEYSGGLRNDYNYYYPQAGINWMGGVVLKF